MGWLKPVAAAATGLLLIILLRCQVHYVTGPLFFHWTWRDIPGGRIYAGMIVAALPLLLGQLLHARWPKLVAVGLTLAMASCFGMKLVSVMFRPDVTGDPTPNLKLISIIVENPDSTSYFTDAATLGVLPLRDWLALYPSVMYRMHLHTGTKPPGPVMYWNFWINALGLEDIDRTALVGGLVLGILQTLAIPATYLFLRGLVRSESAAFCGASFLSLCPGFVLFFPMMDAGYILLSTGIVGFWFLALREDRLRYGLLSGIVLGISGIITFNLLVIGLFMIAIIFVGDRSLGRKLIVGLKQGSAALVTVAVCLLLLRATLDYDVIDTFRHALINQRSVLLKYADHRPYPGTVPWDLADFALGSGWISVALCAFYFAKRETGVPRQLAWLAIGQLIAVAATGLLQMETARVWNFMLPLLMIPVGLELCRWRWPWRLPVLAMMVLVNAAIAQNVKWIY